MSEAVGFVKKFVVVSLLFVCCSSRVAHVDGRVEEDLDVVEVGRAVKAGRRPPAGEALTARSSPISRMDDQAREGLVVASSKTGALSSPVPHG
jgi:hypothetical protein